MSETKQVRGYMYLIKNGMIQTTSQSLIHLLNAPLKALAINVNVYVR